MSEFRNKIAIVTGGASGIGRALCEVLSQREAVVIVADVNIKGAQQVASSITKIANRAYAAHLDVRRKDDVQKLIDQTVSEYGQLDYIFNNAGVAVAGEVRDMTLDHWHRVIDINLLGTLFGTTSAYSLMIRQGFGHIVNIASLAGLIGYPTNIPYATTKYAIIGLSTSLRIEAADLGVKVSVVCPGYVKTGIYEATPVLKANIENASTQISFKMMDATKAAHVILKGIAHNRKIIVFPFYARLLWWVHRVCPSFTTLLGRKIVNEFRAIRSES